MWKTIVGAESFRVLSKMSHPPGPPARSMAPQRARRPSGLIAIRISLAGVEMTPGATISTGGSARNEGAAPGSAAATAAAARSRDEDRQRRGSLGGISRARVWRRIGFRAMAIGEDSAIATPGTLGSQADASSPGGSPWRAPRRNIGKSSGRTRSGGRRRRRGARCPAIRFPRSHVPFLLPRSSRHARPPATRMRA